MIRRLMFWKRPEPAPKPKPDAPVRVTVWLTSGTIVVHYAAFRTVKSDGGLALHMKRDGGGTVADYAPGTWISVSAGRRKVSEFKQK